ncbi:MAG: alpha/beta hydrolase [Candidatus Omnitrophica bacterium]|nr:alpha/beta hydrolase [Candidatus Omnitrophota bacterium]
MLYAAAVLGIILLNVRYLEKRSVFFPSRVISTTPASLGLAFEEINLAAKPGLSVNSWFIPAPGAKFTVLFCHGNAGNIGTRIDKIRIFHNMGLNFFIFDYDGYGKSRGKPTEAGLYRDAHAAYDYLVNKRNLKPSEIIIYGESLGNSASIELASKVNPAGLIAEGSFTNAFDMARSLYPNMPPLFISIKLDSLSRIKKVASPKLFIHSRDDEVVPFTLAKKLFDAAAQPKKLVEISGDHNRAFLISEDSYVNSIESFVAGLELKR